MQENIFDSSRIARFLMILSVFFCIIAGSITAEIGFDRPAITNYILPLTHPSPETHFPAFSSAHPLEIFLWQHYIHAFGTDPLPAKFILLLAHLAVGCLLFRFLSAAPFTRAAAAFAAGLYLLLPVTLQTAVLASGLHDTLQTVLALITLAAVTGSRRRFPGMIAFLGYGMNASFPGILLFLVILLRMHAPADPPRIHRHAIGNVAGFILAEVVLDGFRFVFSGEGLFGGGFYPVSFPRAAAAFAGIAVLLMIPMPVRRWRPWIPATLFPLIVLIPAFSGSWHGVNRLLLCAGLAISLAWMGEMILAAAGSRNLFILLAGCLVLYGVASAMDYSVLAHRNAASIRQNRLVAQIRELLRKFPEDDIIIIVPNVAPEEMPDPPDETGEWELLKRRDIRRVLLGESNAGRVTLEYPHGYAFEKIGNDRVFRWRKNRLVPASPVEQLPASSMEPAPVAPVEPEPVSAVECTAHPPRHRPISDHPLPSSPLCRVVRLEISAGTVAGGPDVLILTVVLSPDGLHLQIGRNDSGAGSELSMAAWTFRIRFQ